MKKFLVFLLVMGASGSALASQILGIRVDGMLMQWNRGSASFTPVGSTGKSGGSTTYQMDLAYDQTSGKLFLSADLSLYSVDPQNGSTQSIGNLVDNLGLPAAMHALDVSPSGILYGHSIGTNGLHKINKSTAATTYSGDNFALIGDYTYDPVNNRYLGVRGSTLYSVNIDTGTHNFLTSVAGLGIVHGLVFDEFSQKVFASNQDGTIFALDPLNNYSSQTLATGQGEIIGLAAVPEPASLLILCCGTIGVFARRRHRS
jgi:hypothetical protein